MNDLLTDAEAAPLLHISIEQLQERCRAGQWQHTRIGRRYLFSPDDLAAIRAACTVKPKAEPAITWGRKTKKAS